MNKKMKNILLFILILFISISLCGCSNNVDDNENENVNISDEEIKNELSLYSDDNKIVYNINDIYYMIYYHEGNVITGLEFVYKYEDVESAKFSEPVIKQSYMDSPNVTKVVRNGRQIVITFNEDQYKGETVESVKRIYAAYQELIKK